MVFLAQKVYLYKQKQLLAFRCCGGSLGGMCSSQQKQRTKVDGMAVFIRQDSGVVDVSWVDYKVAWV